MTGGGSQNTVETQKSDPWSGEQPEIYQGLQGASNLYASNPLGPSYYPGQTYATLNDMENKGLGALNGTGLLGTPALDGAMGGAYQVGTGNLLAPSTGTFNRSQDTLSSLLSPSSIDPSSNPYLQQEDQNITAQVLPQIQSQFNAGGRADSGDAASAEASGLAQALGGLHYGQYNTDVGNALTAAGQAGTNYNSGVTAINQAGAVAPGLNNATLEGEQASFGAGQAIQTDQQNQIQAMMNLFNFNQARPYNALGTFENEVNGSGAQGGTTTTTSPTQSNTFADVGAGLTGALSLGLTGAGLAGYGPLSFMALSDRRLKSDIREVGKAKNGLAIYAYRLLDDPYMRLGFMADEVEKKHPEAVALHPSGFKMVNYDQAARP